MASITRCDICHKSTTIKSREIPELVNPYGRDHSDGDISVEDLCIYCYKDIVDIIREMKAKNTKHAELDIDKWKNELNAHAAISKISKNFSPLESNHSKLWIEVIEFFKSKV